MLQITLAIVARNGIRGITALRNAFSDLAVCTYKAQLSNPKYKYKIILYWCSKSMTCATISSLVFRGVFLFSSFTLHPPHCGHFLALTLSTWSSAAVQPTSSKVAHCSERLHRPQGRFWYVASICRITAHKFVCFSICTFPSVSKERSQAPGLFSSTEIQILSCPKKAKECSPSKWGLKK